MTEPYNNNEKMDMFDEDEEMQENKTDNTSSGGINRILKNLQNLKSASAKDIATKKPRILIDRTIDEFGFVEMDDVSRLMDELKVFKRDINLRNFGGDVTEQELSTTYLENDTPHEENGIQSFIIDDHFMHEKKQDGTERKNDEIIISTDTIREYFCSRKLHDFCKSNENTVNVDASNLNTCTLVNIAIVYLFILIRERERFNLFGKEDVNNEPLSSCIEMNLFEYIARGGYRNSLQILKQNFPERYIISKDTNQLARGLMKFVLGICDKREIMDRDICYSSVCITSFYLYSNMNIDIVLFFHLYYGNSFPRSIFKKRCIIQRH